jgi:hypothetical protein
METQLVLPAFAVLALAAVVGIFWLVRVRSARRIRAAADAHAEREIAREARWRARKAEYARHRRTAI